MIIPLCSDERRMVGIQSQGADISLPKYTTPEQLRDDFAAAIFAHVQVICTTAPAVVDYPYDVPLYELARKRRSGQKEKETTHHRPGSFSSRTKRGSAEREGWNSTQVDVGTP